jgi:putative membrane protein insertion efficiency factor
MIKVLSIFLIKVYRLIVSPLLGARCRFHPSCSAYAQEVFATHSWGRAFALTFKRIMKCHPLNSGGVDFVPER